MQSDGESGLCMEAQLYRKEREWRELKAVRVHQLESSLKKAQEECSSLRELYQQLREDFQFNLAILDERDRELERYDDIIARALTMEHNRQKELSQLRMQITRLEEQRAKEAEERQEGLVKSRHNAAQHRLQLDKLKRSMADEIQNQTEEHERMTWDLQRRIQEVEGEMTLQRQEMTAAFDRELRQRKHEYNLKMDEMCAVVLSHDLKVKLLSKETEDHFQAQRQATQALKASEEFSRHIQTQLQHKDREIQELTAVKDCRYENAVQALRECDAQLEAQRQAHTEQLQKAEKHIVELQENMEVLAAQVHCIQRDHQEAMEQKDETIQSLRKEVETTRIGWDKYINHVSGDMVVKNTEMIALQERETQLRTELERSREDMERYKQQLSAGLKRERALEQMQVQVELEWQRHCDDVKAKHYLANEQLIQDLTQARDQAKAELKEKEQELQDLTVLLHSVKTERDQAMKGLTPKVDSLASEEIRCLQEQNNILRAVVAQMRKDMEGLSHPLPHPQARPQASSPQPLRHPEAPADISITPTADAQVASGPLPQSTDISSKVSPAGGLFLEKCAKTSVLTKQEGRVAHTETAPANITEQSALMQQLQEENLYLRQQQALGLFENVQGARSNIPLLRSRLKQAASCIARLSSEKQQLIEMGNRLRAQITTAGLQEPVEPEKDTATEKQEDQHDRMSALEQLQYRLTTQELQYALRQRVCTAAEQLLPGTNNQSPTTKVASNPWSQGHKITDRSESSTNKENTPLLSQSRSSLDAGPRPHSGLSRSRLSSEESLQSLKELWEILDHVLSSSIYSEGKSEPSRREMAESGDAGVQMMVHGISAPIYSQSPTAVQQRMNPSKTPPKTTKTNRPGAPGKISKIRNYNAKD
ncbi:coiled-coil domain-containing protein 57 isoform X3 [Xiphias gladius]|nr:coiled-coil domain-containing protein 57 isoform X3 [Xiphias gladius]